MKSVKAVLTSLLAVLVLTSGTPSTYAWSSAQATVSVFGGSNNDQGNSIAVDSSGNIYTTGYFQNTVDFDPGDGTYDLTSAGGFDVFVSKLDSSGNFVWAKRFGGTENDYGNSIAVDSGNVYTTGIFQLTVDFNPGGGTYDLTSAAYADVFVSKLDSSGDFVWAKRFGSTSSDVGHSIAVDSIGNVYTIGEFSLTVDFDPGGGTYDLTSAGAADVFVSKLDSSGDFVWAKSIGGNSMEFVGSSTLDSSGNVYTIGTFQETVDFDPGDGTSNLTSAGSGDVFVLKLTSTGENAAPATAPATAPAPAIPTYQVAYLANGGESRNLPMATRYYGNEIIRTTTSIPTRVGYTFLNWNSSADGTGKIYLAGDLISIGDSDRTLYAQWKINTYKLDFESSFDNLMKMDSKIENYGTTTTLPGLPTDFVRIGHTFLGWNTNKDGSGTKYLVGDKFIYPASDTTLFAQWKINTYSIAFDGNGLQRGKTPAVTTQEFNSALTIKSPTGSLTRKGYKFECWNTERDGSGKDFKAGDVLVIGASNQTLYAKWTPNSYRVTYLSAFQESSIIDQFLTDGSILSAPTPKNRQGYIFKGWSNSPYKTNIVSFPYTPGVTRNISLYAVWERTK